MGCLSGSVGRACNSYLRVMGSSPALDIQFTQLKKNIYIYVSVCVIKELITLACPAPCLYSVKAGEEVYHSKVGWGVGYSLVASRSVSLPICPQAVSLLSLESYGLRRKLTAINWSADTESTTSSCYKTAFLIDQLDKLAQDSFWSWTTVFSALIPSSLASSHKYLFCDVNEPWEYKGAVGVRWASRLKLEAHLVHFQACSGKEAPHLL